jgi:hypothetical protein
VKAAELGHLPYLFAIVNKHYTGAIIVIKPISKRIFTCVIFHIVIAEIFLMVVKKYQADEING